MDSIIIILVPLYAVIAFAIFLYGGFFYTCMVKKSNIFTRWYVRHFTDVV